MTLVGGFMSVLELIKKRRTIHTYKSQKVDEEHIMNAIEAANMAPNHKLTFPWRFTVISDQKRDQIIQLAVQLKKEKDAKFSEIKEKALCEKLKAPSHMIAIRCLKSESTFQQQEDYASVASAIQNMSLYLWENEIGSKWSTAGFTSHDKAYELLKINSNKEMIVGFLFVGYFERLPPKVDRPEIKTLIDRV